VCQWVCIFRIATDCDRLKTDEGQNARDPQENEGFKDLGGWGHYA
jgi:hypothetical protein